MVFFTLSGNILYTYVLPGLPAFAMMVSEMLSLRFDNKSMMQSKWLYAGLIIPVVGLIFMAIVWITPEKLTFEKNQQYLVAVFQNTRQSENSQLSYEGERLFSIDFHTQGQAQQIQIDANVIDTLLNNSVEDYLIVQKNNLPKLPDNALKNFELISEYRKYALLREK